MDVFAWRERERVRGRGWRMGLLYLFFVPLRVVIADGSTLVKPFSERCNAASSSSIGLHHQPQHGRGHPAGSCSVSRSRRSRSCCRWPDFRNVVDVQGEADVKFFFLMPRVGLVGCQSFLALARTRRSSWDRSNGSSTIANSTPKRKIAFAYCESSCFWAYCVTFGSSSAVLFASLWGGSTFQSEAWTASCPHQACLSQAMCAESVEASSKVRNESSIIL